MKCTKNGTDWAQSIAGGPVHREPVQTGSSFCIYLWKE